MIKYYAFFSFSCIDSHIHFIPHRRIGLSKSLLGEEAYNRTLEKLNKDLPEDKKVRTVKSVMKKRLFPPEMCMVVHLISSI